MAIRLNDLVVCGEINNNTKNSVHGWLGLEGHKDPLVFELTGNCEPDLAGQYVRFEISSALGSNGITKLDLSSMAWRQIGPTGKITAGLSRRDPGCPVEELYQRCNGRTTA